MSFFLACPCFRDTDAHQHEHEHEQGDDHEHAHEYERAPNWGVTPHTKIIVYLKAQTLAPGIILLRSPALNIVAAVLIH